jgi:hypothetical protein
VLSDALVRQSPTTPRRAAPTMAPERPTLPLAAAGPDVRAAVLQAHARAAVDMETSAPVEESEALDALERRTYWQASPVEQTIGEAAREQEQEAAALRARWEADLCDEDSPTTPTQPSAGRPDSPR